MAPFYPESHRGRKKQKPSPGIKPNAKISLNFSVEGWWSQIEIKKNETLRMEETTSLL